jgi:hypothetical protein
MVSYRRRFMLCSPQLLRVPNTQIVYKFSKALYGLK